MKLFLLEQSHNDDWDTFDAAIVAAESEGEARGMVPSFARFTFEHVDDVMEFWAEPEHVSVTYLGEYARDDGPCCVLSSFNAA